MGFSPEEQQRYARQMMLPEVGPAGQQKLREARVLCIGAGGLGSPVALYLAAAGVGHLGLADHDRVDLSNLQRQLLHGTPDLGRPKTLSARDRLTAVNPHVEVVLHETRLCRDNALGILRGYDIVVDGTDNFPARYLANDACVLLRKPNVYGSILRWEGQASFFAPHLGGPCYRCLYPEPPPPGAVPSCAEAGVLGAVPGVIGCLQAIETLKFILGEGSSLMGRLVVFDALAARFRELKLRRDPACPVCGENPTIRELVDYDLLCGGVPPAAASEPAAGLEVSVGDLARALRDPSLGITVLDVREPDEWARGRIEGTTLLAGSSLQNRTGELDPARTYYLHCQSGLRSLRAAAWLRSNGFSSVFSVRGGYLAWSQQAAGRD